MSSIASVNTSRKSPPGLERKVTADLAPVPLDAYPLGGKKPSLAASKESERSSKESSAKEPSVVLVPVVPSKAEQPPPSVPEQKKEKKPLKKKVTDTVKRGFSLNVIAVIITAFLQLLVCFYCFAKLITAEGTDLLYLIAFLVMNITALFFTVEVIVSDEKYFVLLSAVDSTIVAGLGTFILIMLIKYSEENVAATQHVAAMTIVIQVCNLCALGHHFYVKYIRKGKKKQAQDEEKAEEAPEVSPPPPRAPARGSPMTTPPYPLRSPPQNGCSTDCGHTPLPRTAAGRSEEHVMEDDDSHVTTIDAEQEFTSPKTKVTWYDTVEATAADGSRRMRYMVEV